LVVAKLKGENVSFGKDVVVSRPIHQASSPVQYEDVDYGIYYMRPIIPIPSLEGTFYLLGLVEYIIIALVILCGVIGIILYAKLRGQYRCPHCKKSYCWEKEIPKKCKYCGAELKMPVIRKPL